MHYFTIFNKFTMWYTPKECGYSLGLQYQATAFYQVNTIFLCYIKTKSGKIIEAIKPLFSVLFINTENNGFIVVKIKTVIHNAN